MTTIIRATALVLATVMATGALAQNAGNDGRGGRGGSSAGGSDNPLLTARFDDNDVRRRIRKQGGDDLCRDQIGIGRDALIVLRRCDHRR